MNELSFEPDWVSAPGATVVALTIEKSYEPNAMSEVLGLGTQELQAFFDGDLRIDQCLAERLAASVGATARFWINRDRDYQAQLEKAANKLTSSMKFPISDLERFGWINPRRYDASDALAVARFLGVKTPADFDERYGELEEALAFRRSATFDLEIGAVSAWYRAVELECARLKVSDWSPTRFTENLREIRSLTRLRQPSEFLNPLTLLCAESGVAFCLVRAPAGCPVSGIAQMVNGRAVIALTSRHLTDDHFWFSFFHEAGHLLLHSDQIGIDVDAKADGEDEANEFARDLIVPKSSWSKLMRLDVSKFSIVRFARDIGVSPGLVVGQLQKAKRIRYNQFNYLKNRFQWHGTNLERA